MRTLEDFFPWIEMMCTFSEQTSIKTECGIINIKSNMISLGTAGWCGRGDILSKRYSEDQSLSHYYAINDLLVMNNPEVVLYTHHFGRLSESHVSTPYPCTEEMYFQLSTTQEMHHKNCPVEYESYAEIVRFSKSIQRDEQIAFAHISNFLALSDYDYETITQALRNYVNENS